MMSITASVNGQMVHTYHADGLIISTPTGSTAYSMSVGGPLVIPQTQNFILSPIASHSLNVRPLIIPDSWTIELEVHSRSLCYLCSLLIIQEINVVQFLRQLFSAPSSEYKVYRRQAVFLA